ncbi:MAG: hypothetical protein HY986_02150 [Candidatus Melainabacteria bacterium]|nr:hypothetical protein [Candidatus Melainabacteria bacterium]
MNNPNQKPKFPLTLEQERLCSWMLIWQGGALLALILLANFLPVNFGWIVVGMVPVMVDLYFTSGRSIVPAVGLSLLTALSVTVVLPLYTGLVFLGLGLALSIHADKRSGKRS